VGGGGGGVGGGRMVAWHNKPEEFSFVNKVTSHFQYHPGAVVIKLSIRVV
jgi:hypothetical protein